MDTVRSRSPHSLIVLLLVIAWGLLTIRIDAPWFGHHDANGSWVSAAVRNYQLYGAWELGFMQITNPGPANPTTYFAYTHHPPLVVWLSALASLAFGLSELTLRFVVASATLLSVAAFYVWVRRLYGNSWALLATALYALNPMLAYFGRMPNHEALALAVGMLYAAVFVNWFRVQTRGRYLALVALACIAGWTAWSATLYVGVLSVAAFIVARRAQRWRILGLMIALGLSLGALLAFYQLNRPDVLADLLDVFQWRASSQSFRRGSPEFTWPQFAGRVTLRMFILATPYLWLMGMAGLPPALRHTSRLGKAMLLALFAAGGSYVLVLRNAAFIHDYYGIFLIPPLTVGASAVWVFSIAKIGVRRFIRPTLAGLLLASVVVGAATLSVLHKTGEGTHQMILAQNIRQRTSPTDQVMSNLPQITPAIEYYAFRNVRWDTAPEAVRDIVATSDSHGLYVYCTDVSFAPTSNYLYAIDRPTFPLEPPRAPPPELAGTPYEVDGGCLFFKLDAL